MREPRPYQQKAHDAVREAVRAKKRRILLVSPTGSGKTFMLSRIIQGAEAKGKRCAFFAHRRELLHQTVKTLRDFGIEAGLGTERPDALTQVLSTQAAMMRGEVPPADIVFLDEAHHYASDEWSQLPLAYPEALIVGATATPERGDGRPLTLFEHLIPVCQPSDLVPEFLVPCEVIRPGRLLKPNEVAQDPVDAYRQHTNGRLAVVFVPSVELAKEMAAKFTSQGIPAEAVWGQMKKDDRDAALTRLATRRTLVVVNVFVLTEGWDCPPVDVVIIARRLATQGAFMQAAGRGLRTHPGKRRMTLLDLPGITWMHGHPLEDRVFSLEGFGMSRVGIKGISYCKSCGKPIELCECGFARDAIELTVTNDPMVKFAHIRRDNDEGRAVRLAKWIREARGSRTGNWKAALPRYKGAYGGNAPSAVISQALAIADRRQWCRECGTSKCQHAGGAA